MTFQCQCFQTCKTIGTHGIDLFLSKKILRQCSKTIFVVADGGGGQIQHSFQFCPRGQHGVQVEAGGSFVSYTSFFPHHQIKRVYLSKTWWEWQWYSTTQQHKQGEYSIGSKCKDQHGQKEPKEPKRARTNST